MLPAIGFTKLSWLKVILKKEKVAPVYTGILGGLLPLCSCSMLPVANLINSMSKSYAPVLSFLIIAPVISPVTLLLTYGYFGLSMTLVRLIGTFIFAISFAYLVSFFFTKPKTLPIMMGGDGKSKNSKLFFYILKDNLFGIGKYLFLGIFIASLIKVFVPASLIKPIAGSIFSYPLISFIRRVRNSLKAKPSISIKRQQGHYNSSPKNHRRFLPWKLYHLTYASTNKS